MVEVCEFCGLAVPMFGSVHLGTAEGDEMVLCSACAEVVLPGVADLMRDSCPICAMNGRHN